MYYYGTKGGKMKKVFFALLIVFSFVFMTGLSLSSCSNNSNSSKNTESFTIEITNGNKEDLTLKAQTWHITNKKVCVLFGYDFNTPDIVANLTDILSDTFGLAENGGLIEPVVYPNDFKHGAKGYVNDFISVLQDNEKDYAGVVLLGAPDNTHRALAKNQDKWEENIPYPVIALFPQDEVLGIEATCDIVLDKGQTVELEDSITNEETVSSVIKEAPDIIIRTINYMLALEGPLPADSSVQTHITQMLNGYEIHHYTDPETGLQSINHFVLN